MGKLTLLSAKDGLHIVETIQQDTLQCAVLLTPGPVKLVPGTGKIDRAKGTTGNTRVYGITNQKRAGNMPSTLIRRGILYGYDFTGINYDTVIYVDDDGDLSTQAGTTSVPVGRVVPLKGELFGSLPNKGLSVEL